MNISVFGLGYVGCVTMACLAKIGNNAIGVDVHLNKIERINKGLPTIIEPDLELLMLQGFENKLISATSDFVYAFDKTDLIMICVGTPNKSDGSLDMSNVYKVTSQLAHYLKDHNKFFTIVLRSTVMPGTNDYVVSLIEGISRKKHIQDFAVVNNPEFLREGSAINDFFNPPLTAIASKSKKGIENLKKLYKGIKTEFIETDISVTELIKFVNNSFHALKVSFANEIGRICSNLNVNSQSLMDLFVKDTFLNISPKYFMPGQSYGGSCLPKDLKALEYISGRVQTPIISSIEQSNANNTTFIFNKIISYKPQSILIYGISFKDNTDDLRNSPGIDLINRLLDTGISIKIYDRNVNFSDFQEKAPSYLVKRSGINESLFLKSLKHFPDNISQILLNQKLIKEDLDIISNNLSDKNTLILDIVGNQNLNNLSNYRGVSW